MKKLRIVVLTAVAASAFVTVTPAPAHACSGEGIVDPCVVLEGVCRASKGKVCFW